MDALRNESTTILDALVAYGYQSDDLEADWSFSWHCLLNLVKKNIKLRYANHFLYAGSQLALFKPFPIDMEAVTSDENISKVITRSHRATSITSLSSIVSRAQSSSSAMSTSDENFTGDSSDHELSMKGKQGTYRYPDMGLYWFQWSPSIGEDKVVISFPLAFVELKKHSIIDHKEDFNESFAAKDGADVGCQYAYRHAMEQYQQVYEQADHAFSEFRFHDNLKHIYIFIAVGPYFTFLRFQKSQDESGNDSLENKLDCLDYYKTAYYALEKDVGASSYKISSKFVEAWSKIKQEHLAGYTQDNN